MSLRTALFSYCVLRDNGNWEVHLGKPLAFAGDTGRRYGTISGMLSRLLLMGLRLLTRFFMLIGGWLRCGGRSIFALPIRIGD
jgi:hypothetical protein